jgi:hypothetical protein
VESYYKFFYTTLPNIYDIKDDQNKNDDNKLKIPSVIIEKDGQVIEKTVEKIIDSVEKIIEKDSVEKMNNHDSENVNSIEVEHSEKNVLPITGAIGDGGSGES